MPLTRRQLRRLQLSPDTIDAVLRLHEESVNTLVHERDAWQKAAGSAEQLKAQHDAMQQELQQLRTDREEAERMRADYAAYRTQVEGAARSRALQEAAVQALRCRGANERAIPLLLQAVDLSTAVLREDGGMPALEDEAALLDGVQATYADFFAEPRQLGLPVLEPPCQPAPLLSTGDVRGMSTEEINSNWSAVKAALANP